MKTNIFKASRLALMACGLLAATACDDLFEPAQENISDLELMYSDANFAQGLLGNAYILMPYYSTPDTDVATDDAVSNDNSNAWLQMATGSWSSQSNPLSQWQNRQNAIQYCNALIEGADKVNWSANPKLQRLFSDLFKGDAYGMRALQTFYLLRAHAGIADGEMLGVPLIHEYLPSTSNFNLPRATFKACIDSIMLDIDRALELLPFEYGDINDAAVPAKYQGYTGGEYSRAFGTHQKGKINGMILRALKAQVALYAASPAFVQYSGKTAEEATKAAAKDAADCMAEMKKHGITYFAENGLTWYCNVQEIAGLNKGYNAPECIWQGTADERLDHEQSYYPPSVMGSGRINPSQNLVDAFPMANGYPITDSKSGYDANKPYEGRDPRLATFILLDGQTMSATDKEIVTGTYVSGNVDGINFTQGASTRTGYYMRKLLRPDVNLNSANQTKQKSYDARIRKTEILLAYAEAANEAVGPTDASLSGSDLNLSAKAAIKMIRERAGICVGVEDPYLNECAANKDAMRELIRNERRLELCFENHRFFDLRRWQVGAAKLSETVKGAEIAVAGGPLKVIDVESHQYQDFQNFGPIPYSEMLKYSELKQNQGW